MTEGADTVVEPTSSGSSLADMYRACCPRTRLLLLIQDPPNATVRDSTRELLSPEVSVL